MNEGLLELVLSSWVLSMHEPFRQIASADSSRACEDAEAFARIAAAVASATPNHDQVPAPLAEAGKALADEVDLGSGTHVAMFCAAAARLWPALTHQRRAVLIKACQHTIRGYALCIQGGVSQAGSLGAARNLVELENGLGFRASVEEYDRYGGWVGGTVAAAQLFALSADTFEELADARGAAILADDLLDWIDSQVAAARESNNLVDVLSYAHRLYMRESLVVTLLESLRREGVKTKSVALGELSHFVRVAEEHRVEYARLLIGHGRHFFDLARVEPARRLHLINELDGNLPVLPNNFIEFVKRNQSLDSKDFQRAVLDSFEDAEPLLKSSARRTGPAAVIMHN